jgi:hypothetical protein
MGRPPMSVEPIYFHPRIDSGLIKLGLRLSAALLIRSE